MNMPKGYMYMYMLIPVAILAQMLRLVAGRKRPEANNRFALKIGPPFALAGSVGTLGDESQRERGA